MGGVRPPRIFSRFQSKPKPTSARLSMKKSGRPRRSRLTIFGSTRHDNREPRAAGTLKRAGDRGFLVGEERFVLNDERVTELDLAKAMRTLLARNWPRPRAAWL